MTTNYGECPNCGTQCWLDMDTEPYLLRIKDRHPTDTDYGPGESWTEVWECPNCDFMFEEDNGYP